MLNSWILPTSLSFQTLKWDDDDDGTHLSARHLFSFSFAAFLMVRTSQLLFIEELRLLRLDLLVMTHVFIFFS